MSPRLARRIEAVGLFEGEGTPVSGAKQEDDLVASPDRAAARVQVFGRNALAELNGGGPGRLRQHDSKPASARRSRPLPP